MLQIEELTKRYGAFLALDHLSLTLGDGELHGFVGPNGAGKTTTMRILATLLPATSGRAVIDGVEIGKNGKRARALVGYMPDFFGVYDNLKTWEYLDFYARCYGIEKKRRATMTAQLLALVNLEEKRDAYVDSLSRGMIDEYYGVAHSDSKDAVKTSEFVILLSALSRKMPEDVTAITGIEPSEEQTLSRLDAARAIDTLLHPFERDVDFKGNLK